MSQHQITMGAGLLPPQHPVELARPAAPGPRGRRVLAAVAVASPVLFAGFIATDPGVLPREPAAEFLGAIAEAPDQYLAATTLQLLAMITGLGLALAVGTAFRSTSRVLAPVAGAVLAVGYLGGTGFVGAKLVAADLVRGGEIRPGAEEAWTAVQSGPLFDVMSWPLLMAILGALLLTVVLVRGRREVSWWPAVAYAAGFVLASGEFTDAVTLVGAVLQVLAVVAIARQVLRAA